nr:coat protein [Rhizoctonia solani dsRNA virus 2]
MSAKTDQVSVSAPDAAPGNPQTPTAAAVPTAPSANPEPASKSSTKSKGVRKTLAFSSSSPGIAPLLNSIANVNVSIPQRNQTNFFFPDATCFMRCVSTCDQAMSTTKKFLDGTESWTAFVSQYYASLLWHLQVFRTYAKSGIPDQEGQEFLDFFEKRIDLLNIPVPGPWIPFLRSLSVVEAHHESYGNIAPVLPAIATTPLNSANFFSWPPVVSRSIPNPLLPLDQLHAIAGHAMGQNNANAFVAYTNIMGMQLIGANDFNNVASLLLNPTSHSWSSASRSRTATVVEFWHDHANMLPTRLVHNQAANQEINTYFRYFGFESVDGTHPHGMLETVLNDMALYCQFFKGSAPFSTVDIVGLGASIPRHLPISTTAVRAFVYPTINQLRANRHAQGHRHFPSDLLYNMSHGDLTLDTVGEQYAMSTLVNSTFGSILTQNGHDQIPLDDQVEGPFWAITTMRQAKGFSPIPSFSTVIPAYYHVTTPVTPKTS